MEIKIQCDCGQRYKLDVEPVNGLMPFAVNCPICVVDGTQKGNDLIRLALANEPIQASQAPPPLTAVPAASATPGRLKLSLSQSAHATVPAASAEPQAPAAPTVFAGQPAAAEEEPAETKKPRKPSFGLGLLGGFGGALVGSILYYVIVQTTGIRLSYFAIGVGGLAGWMAELIGKGEGSKELAGITATLTVAGIIAAQYFLALGVWNHELGSDLGKTAYDISLKEAQDAVKAVPTGSEAEIRSYLVGVQADSGSKPDPSTISADDIKQFHDLQLPVMRDLASGKVTKEQFYAQLGVDPKKEQKRADDDEGTFKSFFILMLIRKSTLFSIAGAAALAFRLCANA